MRDHDLEPVYFNFGDLGHPGWVPVSRLEMRIIWQGVQSMIQQYEREHIEEMLIKTRTRLLIAAMSNQVTPHWFTTALMVTAMSAQLEGKLPEYKFSQG